MFNVFFINSKYYYYVLSPEKKNLGNIITTFILSSCLDFRISEATNDLLSYSVATPPNV